MAQFLAITTTPTATPTATPTTYYFVDIDSCMRTQLDGKGVRQMKTYTFGLRFFTRGWDFEIKQKSIAEIETL